MSIFLPEGIRVLSFDGGDISCISQLRILLEFMKRLEHDTGRKLRPCEYFQLIVGVGASGVIAILLGVLGLSIGETTKAFRLLCEQVLLGEELAPHLRSERLVTATKALLQDVGVPIEARLRGELTLTEGCKVCIPYMLAKNLGNCGMVRSYDSRHSSYNPTIIEAIRVAWATPGIFSSIHVGFELMQEELISAVHGFNNPTLQAIKEAHEAFGGDQLASLLLSLGGGKPPIRTLEVDRGALALDATKDTTNVDEQLKIRYAGMQIYLRLSVDQNLQSEILSQTLDDRIHAINAHTSVYLESHDANQALDRGVRVSRHPGRITLDNMYRLSAKLTRSSHGLPPLSAFFVPRKEPLDAIAVALRRRVCGTPALALVIGLSGTGKTQIALKYAYDHQYEYDHILFIDASSAESIEKSLISRLRSIDRHLRPTDAQEALDFLVNPEGNLTRNWLVIMDNADDKKLDIRKFIPSCDHGAILVTSRYAGLVDLCPEGHISLDVMSSEEAIEALLLAALGTKIATAPEGTSLRRTEPISRAKNDLDCAAKIVKELGCLPLAIIQAASYIKTNRCLHEYSQRLLTSRSKILRWPMSVQRDRPQYESTYAAFDTNIKALSSRALWLLGILSFVHFSDFPRDLIPLAASLGFRFQPHDLLDQSPELQPSIDMLNKLFCPNGQWDQIEFDSLLEELQAHSLVAFVPILSVITLRFHPLLHGWANDRLPASEKPLFRSGASRILICGTHPDHDYLWPHLSPHVECILSTNEVHVNDVAALAAIRKNDGQSYKVRKMWEEIYAVVESIHGEKHVRTTRAALQLADAFGFQGDWDRMEDMVEKVVEVRRHDLGDEHVETAYAMADLAGVYRLRGERYEDAAKLQLAVVRIRRREFGSKHREIVNALSKLAETLMLQKKYVEANSFLAEALRMITALVGRTHVATIRIMEQIASCHKSSGDMETSIQLEHNIMQLWRTVRGAMHSKTFEVMTKIAVFQSLQGHYRQAEQAWRELEGGRREMLGDQHSTTLDALFCLAHAIGEQGRHGEAEVLLREVLAARQEALGDQHEATLEAKDYFARILIAQGRLDEAEFADRTLNSQPESRRTFSTLRALADGPEHAGAVSSPSQRGEDVEFNKESTRIGPSGPSGNNERPPVNESEAADTSTRVTQSPAHPPPALPVEIDMSDEDDAVPSGVLLTGKKLALAHLGFLLAMFCVGLGLSIVSTALPKLSSQFDALDELTWVISVYVLTQACFILFFHQVLTITSSKWVYLACLLFFEIGSLICAVAPSMPVLIFGRAFQGIGASGIFDSILSLLSLHTRLEQRPILFGGFGLAFALASVVGPIIGGLFADRVTWRWCFWFNLPFGAISIASALTSIPHSHPPSSQSYKGMTSFQKWLSLDWIGAFISVGMLTSLLLPLQWGGTRYEWNDPKIIGLFCTFACLFIGFVVWELFKKDRAMLQLDLFRRRTQLGVSLAMFFMGFAFVGTLVYLPFFYQAKGRTAVESGLDVIPFVLSSVVLAGFSGGIVNATGHYLTVLIAGPLVASIGAGLLFTVNEETTSAALIGYQILLGAGLGASSQIPVLASQAEYALEVKLFPKASSMIHSFQQLGATVGIAIAGTIFKTQLSTQLKTYASNLSPELTQAVQKSVVVFFSLSIDLQRPVIHAYVKTLNYAFLLTVPACICAALGSLLVKNWNLKTRVASAAVV